MAVNTPLPGKQPPPLTKKLISSVVGAPANKSNQASKQPLKGMDALVTLLPTKEATPAPPPPVVDNGQEVEQPTRPSVEPWRRAPIRAMGEVEGTPALLASMDLLNRNPTTEYNPTSSEVLNGDKPKSKEEAQDVESIDISTDTLNLLIHGPDKVWLANMKPETKKYIETQQATARRILMAQNPDWSEELAELHRRDNEITADTINRIYCGNADNEATPEEATVGTDAMKLFTPLSTHHAYSSKHHLSENETDMTQQEQTQAQETKQVVPFLNVNGHTAAIKYFDDEVIAKLDSALTNYGTMSPFGFVENYNKFKDNLKNTCLEGNVPAYLARYNSNIAFIELAGKIDESVLHRTAITSGIRAIDIGHRFGQPCSSEITSANSVRCAWDVVDAIAYASAIVNICNRWIYSVDPTMAKTIDFSEELLSKGVHTAIIDQRDTGNFHENAASYRKSHLKQVRSIANTSQLMLELVEVSEKLLDKARSNYSAASLQGLQENYSAIDELQNAAALGISMLSDAINFMSTGIPRYTTNTNGHFWLTNPDANIHMCVSVDENYLVSVELNLYIQDELRLAIMQQEAIFDEALMVYLPGDVSINASIMDSLKKAMMDAYIAGRQSTKSTALKPTFGPEQGANVGAMREGLKRVRYSSTNSGGTAIQLQSAPRAPL